MTRRQSRRRARAAFTLIELLVVIAIIAVLVGLTTAAIMQVLGKGPQVQTRTEIGDLEGAIANAKANLNNVSYIPSRLVLRDDGNYTHSNDEVRTSLWLQQAFGKRSVSGPVDWNNNGNLTDVITLNGSQCLVFVLGGIQINGAPMGFSTNSANPAAPPVAGATRKGPFYEFKTSRLIPGPGGYLVYADPYGKNMPYLYMSWYGRGNDYNFNPSDCAPILPYSWNNRFINANGFQIISAGKDGQYGPGGNWNPASGYVGFSPGTDDLANFSPNLLGTPQR